MLKEEIEALESVYSSDELKISNKISSVIIKYWFNINENIQILISFVVNFGDNNTTISVLNSDQCKSQLSQKILQKITKQLNEIFIETDKNDMPIFETISYCNNNIDAQYVGYNEIQQNQSNNFHSEKKQSNDNDDNTLFDELDEIKNIEGKGTNLISLYIPPKQSQKQRLNDLLKNEMNSCQNIKDRSIRNAVKNALSSIQNKLKYLNNKDYSPNGLVIFCGENRENKNRIFIKTISSPIYISKLLYFCGKKFNTEKLEENLLNNNLYGIIIINGQEIYIGTKCGKQINHLYSKSVKLPKKQKKGGSRSKIYQESRL